MPEIAELAERMRLVRGAYERFLALAAIDCILERGPTAAFESSEPSGESDPYDHDWSQFYRGSVLDD